MNNKDQKVVILSEERYEFLASLEKDFDRKVEEEIIPYRENYEHYNKVMDKARELFEEQGKDWWNHLEKIRPNKP